MILKITTLDNNQKDSLFLYLKDIKEISNNNQKLQQNIKKEKIEGIIISTDDIIKNKKLIIFLMDIDANIIILINNKKNYYKNLRFQDLLGIQIVNNLTNQKELLNKKIQKNTIPHINNLIEETINLIEKELKENQNVRRYIAMQIIYENPYYIEYLKNTKIKIQKENLDYMLNGKTIEIIDDSINLIK